MFTTENGPRDELKSARKRPAVGCAVDRRPQLVRGYLAVLGKAAESQAETPRETSGRRLTLCRGGPIGKPMMTEEL